MSDQRRLPVPAATMAALVALTGCASIPDVTIAYRPVHWAVAVAVVDTITCTPGGGAPQQLIVDRLVTVGPGYAAAPTGPSFQIRLQDLDRFYADTDFKIAFTADGRLKSINTSSQGQGEAIASKLVEASAAIAVARMATSDKTKALLPENGAQRELTVDQAAICKVVAKWSSEPSGRPPHVVVTQTAVLTTLARRQAASAAPSQEELVKELRHAALDLSVAATAAVVADDQQPIAGARNEVGSGEVGLTLQRIGKVKVAVFDAQRKPLRPEDQLDVPLADQVFMVPVPRAALFGKQTFELSLAESGRIVSIGYGRSSGVASALGAVKVLEESGTAEDKAKAAALKNANDLIKELERQKVCRETPQAC